jgi:hypothetical protein
MRGYTHISTEPGLGHELKLGCVPRRFATDFDTILVHDDSYRRGCVLAAN